MNKPGTILYIILTTIILTSSNAAVQNQLLLKLRAYPNNRVVMRPSEKSEAKAAGQKGSEAWFCHVENVFGRQRRHRALQPAAIERVIWIGSKLD